MGVSVHAADPAVYLGAPDCRVAPLMKLNADNGVAWSGSCKDGYADGKGVLTWRVPDKGKWTLEGMLARGDITGEATMVYHSAKYIGTFKDGMPNGVGYFEFAKSGDRYEGGIVNFWREGTGVLVALDGSTYEGQWKQGRRHGRGKATFTLGGSYEGEWRDDKFHGQGKIVYSGGRTYAGEFVGGRALGAAPAPSGDVERFGLKDEHPAIGSHVRRERSIGFAPPDASWSQLTPAQQAMQRNAYPALDDGDEPPYPLKGTRALQRDVAQLYRKFTDYQGDALVYLTVGPDGAPTSVSTYGVKHQEFGRYLSMAAMMQRFKPALCAGSPCAMIFPISFKFYLE